MTACVQPQTRPRHGRVARRLGADRASAGAMLACPRTHRITPFAAEAGMADKDKGADKTEKPTPKKIKDARKEGNVAKSKELTSTVLVLGWLVGGWLMMGFMYRKMRELFDASLGAVGRPFDVSMQEVGRMAFDTLLWLSLPLLALALFLGVLVEFLQVGPLVTIKKITPQLD
jgi:type III secretion protein U